MKSLTPFIVIAISVGMYFVYISPGFVEINTQRNKITEYINVLEKSKELKNKRDSVLTAYNNISEEDITRLNKIIPETFDAVLFANDINNLASRHNVTVKDIKINAPDSESRVIPAESTDKLYKTTAVTLTLSGEYQQFIKFMADIETSLRLMDISSLTVKSGGKSGSNLLDYSLEIYTYSLK
ncbi:MAG: type 4a pilus biogenesis protein PilO [Candidatus Zambryskibacteria bacterium]|nr:type 4a pilus biogenesis protein PilO [Candidatus Zambryskibacteria bacterium]